MTDILDDVREALRPTPHVTRACNAQNMRHNGRPRLEDVKPLPNGLLPLSTKWRTVLSLELRGMTKKDIAAKLDTTPITISWITRQQRYIDHRDFLLKQADEEFFNLKPTALNAIRTGLNSSDEKTASQNARWYFETLGYGAAREAASVTAEDVIGRLFENANVTIEQHAHVHYNEATRDAHPRNERSSSGERLAPSDGGNSGSERTSPNGS